MLTKKILSILFLLSAITVYSQKNFQLSPEKPKAGDLITITYEPAGDIANTILPVEAVVYVTGSKGQTADDVMLKQQGKKLTGTIQTDTSQSFLYLAFTSDKKFDNNYNEGYWVQLADGQNAKKGSNLALSQFYQYNQAGVERNNDKALASLEKEIALFPESRKTTLVQYLRLQATMKKEGVNALVQKEIENAMKQGMKEEADYTLLENLYTIAKLPEQAKLITSVKKEKFPNGRWTMTETLSKYTAETDIAKKEQMLEQIIKNVKTDENWKALESSLYYYKMLVPTAYRMKKDWEGFKNAVAKSELKPSDLASLYNTTAKEMAKTGENLKYAEELSLMAVTTAKNEWQNPSVEKPAYYPKKQWDKSRETVYASYADTYGMVMYKLGEYKKGLAYSKEAVSITKGNNPEQNKTYALLSEKAQPSKKYKPELEKFVKEGKATPEIKEVLKRLYAKENKSETGFDDYLAALEKESYMKMIAELKKAMLSDTAPSFALLDLDGKKINISDLKGKVVVVDFWATWCGPCKASFPAMQKMVSTYKENPGVKFIFVDTWETTENKEKNAANFITDNKYSFHVLMDNDNKVVEQFSVNGIPTKFVIDKDGLIRFKSIGFNGSDDKLISELTAMIEMANDPSKKAF